MSTSPTNPAPGESDSFRWKYGIIAVALGLGAVLAAERPLARSHWNGFHSRNSDYPVAAVIGAYFGGRASSSATKDAQDRAATAESDKAKTSQPYSAPWTHRPRKSYYHGSRSNRDHARATGTAPSVRRRLRRSPRVV